VTWIHANVIEWQPAPSSFDLVLLLYLHLPWQDVATVFDHARSAVASRGTFLLIGHDRSNLEHGCGGPRRPEVMYRANDIAEFLTGFDIEDAGTRTRAVETEGGTRLAIGCLVRARRTS